MARTLSATLLCLYALCLAACGGFSSDRATVRYVPSDSLIALSVNWKTVGRDADLKRLVKGEQVESLLGRLNIGGEEVSDLSVFSDGQNAPFGSSGMIIRGMFDGREVAARLKGAGWAEQKSGEKSIYTNPVDGSCLVALSKSLIVLGTRAGVEGSIRAARVPEESFTASPMYERLARHTDGRRHPISVTVAFPQSAQDAASTVLEVSSVVMDFAGLGPLGDLMNKIGYVRAFGCSISRKGDVFPVELHAVMKDEASASLVSGALTLSKGLSAMAPGYNLSQTQAEELRILQSLSVNRDGELLSVKLMMSVNSLNSRY